MRLKIQNPDKIVGARIDRWVIERVVESQDWYSFLCREDNPNGLIGMITNIRLSREGILESGIWKFRFWRPAGKTGYNQVTADWFGNIQNACKVIETELRYN